MFKILLYVSLLTSSLFSYHFAYLNMNNEELQSGLHFDLAQFNYKYEVNRYFVGLDYLYIEEEDNGDYDSFVDMAFLMQSRVEAFPPLIIGMGLKALYLEKEENEFMAIPLTLSLKIEYPIFGIMSRLSGSFSYSPKPLTFRNGYRYVDSHIELGFDIVKRGSIFIGYRDIEAHFFENLKIDNRFSEAPYIGLRFGF